jgi:hypothetical protein
MVSTTRQAAPRKAPTTAKKAVAPSGAPAKALVTAPAADSQAAVKGKRVQRTAVKPVKAATPKTAAPKNTAPKAEKKVKTEKIKVVRDSFTIPKTEYAQIADMKKRAMALGKEAKKSELIRAGLALLAATSDAAFSKALASVPTLKTGRPGKA